MNKKLALGGLGLLLLGGIGGYVTRPQIDSQVYDASKSNSSTYLSNNGAESNKTYGAVVSPQAILPFASNNTTNTSSIDALVARDAEQMRRMLRNIGDQFTLSSNEVPINTIYYKNLPQTSTTEQKVGLTYNLASQLNALGYNPIAVDGSQIIGTDLIRTLEPLAHANSISWTNSTIRTNAGKPGKPYTNTVVYTLRGK